MNVEIGQTYFFGYAQGMPKVEVTGINGGSATCTVRESVSGKIRYAVATKALFATKEAAEADRKERIRKEIANLERRITALRKSLS